LSLRETDRFLPAAAVRDPLALQAWWSYLTPVLDAHARGAGGFVRARE
jgi:hypothetical protein